MMRVSRNCTRCQIMRRLAERADMWWVCSVPGQSSDFALLAPLPSDAVKISGPYLTQAKAQAAIGGTAPSGGNAPAATSGWFVIGTVTDHAGPFVNPSGLTVQR